MGICHSYTPDGRCVSLLKVLLTNFCLYDCQYCVNRRSSNVPRARFSPEEVVRLTLDFYRRNCISGLFLSSGIIRSADYTMEQLIRVARCCAKSTTSAATSTSRPSRCRPAADRRGRAPGRPPQRQYRTAHRRQPQAPGAGEAGHTIRQAMGVIHQGQQAVANEPGRRASPRRAEHPGDRRRRRHRRQHLLRNAESLYQGYGLKRVYYSAFSPIPDSPASVPLAAPPLLREHRLYQADFLLRGYGYKAGELLGASGNLALDIDPKLAWALANREVFPLDVNRAEPALLARIPGIGLRSVQRLVALRRERRIRYDDLIQLRCVLDKARPFIVTSDYRPAQAELRSGLLRARLREPQAPVQMGLWG
jgi:predicted DNA-binding helix-hairpin-helix protein